MNSRDSDRFVIFTSFDSVETAEAATGARAYGLKGHDAKDAMVLEYPSGERLVYVSPSARKYREIAASIHGGKLSAQGLDADHVASRRIEEEAGARYVLLARVPLSANRSHGASVEKPERTSERAFNRASLGPVATRGAGSSVPLSFRTSSKLRGISADEMRKDIAQASARPRDLDEPEISWGLFQDRESLDRIQEMKEPQPILAVQTPRPGQEGYGTAQPGRFDFPKKEISKGPPHKKK